MHILLRGVLVFVFTSLLSTSCSDTMSSVSLALPADMQGPIYTRSPRASEQRIRAVPLKALNKNALAGMIDDPEKSDVMYFAFEQSPEMLDLTASGLYALELEFEPLMSVGKSGDAASTNSISTGALSNSSSKSDITGTVQTDVAEFAIGLLYTNDFSTAGKLKENVRPRYPVTAHRFPHRAFSVSIGFAGIAVQPADIRGFMVVAQESLKLKSAAIVPVRYGWLKAKTTLWYGTPADGGVIPPELYAESGIPLCTEFPKPSAVIRTGNMEIEGRDNILIHFDEALPITLTTEQTQRRLSLQCSDKHISVYRAPNVYRLTLDGCLFPEPFLTIEQTDTDIAPDASGRANADETESTTDTATMICGITAEYYTLPPLSPITTDPGIILHWPQTQWRQSSYELFAWEQFPSVLIFDFADYSAQASYLKRLSFYAEK